MVDNNIYYAKNKYGTTFIHFDRDKIMEWYSQNDGVKIWTETKDLFPTVEIIVDKYHIDTRRIRKDNSIMKSPISRLKANDKYDKAKTKKYCLKFNLEHDKALIEKLESVANKQGYIKELISKDLQNN